MDASVNAPTDHEQWRWIGEGRGCCGSSSAFQAQSALRAGNGGQASSHLHPHPGHCLSRPVVKRLVSNAQLNTMERRLRETHTNNLLFAIAVSMSDTLCEVAASIPSSLAGRLWAGGERRRWVERARVARTVQDLAGGCPAPCITAPYVHAAAAPLPPPSYLAGHSDSCSLCAVGVSWVV